LKEASDDYFHAYVTVVVMLLCFVWSFLEGMDIFSV